MAFVPLVGPIIRALGLQEWHGGLMIALAGVFWMLTARRWGAASDRLGRKPMLLASTLGYVLAYACLALVVDVALAGTLAVGAALLMLIALRALIGAFYAGIPSISAALVADHTTPAQRARTLAQLGAANGLGLVLGPALGGLLVGQGLAWPLYVAALLPMLGLLWLWATLPAGEVVASAPPPPRGGVFDARLRLPVMAMFIAMGAVVVSQMVVGFYVIDRLGLSPQDAGRVASQAMTAVGVVLICVQVTMSRRAALNIVRCLWLGSAIAALGFLLVTLWVSQWGLIASYALMAAGLALVFPSLQALAANSVGPDEQGRAAGQVAAAQGLAMVLMPLLATVLYRLHSAAPYWMAATLLVLFALAVWRQLARQSAQAAPSDQIL